APFPHERQARAALYLDHHSGFSRRCVVAMIYFCPLASIAASTFGGDISSSVSCRPVARSIALAMAAIGGHFVLTARKAATETMSLGISGLTVAVVPQVGQRLSRRT